ncbi:MAG: DUF929 family protein, partial [Acidimicrobiales bacterium]
MTRETANQNEVEDRNKSEHGHARGRRIPTALITWVFIIIVAIVALALIGLKLLSSPIVIEPNPFPAASSATILELSHAALSTLSGSGVYDTAGLATPVLVGAGGGRALTRSSHTQVTAKGHPTLHLLPEVTFVGSEYCPYCEAASWPLVIALSRFGTISKLKIASSSSSEVFPSISGFSFYHMAYASNYVDFTGIEEASSIPSNNPYKGFSAMNAPSRYVSSLLQRYDVPPNVAQANRGVLPFLDISNQVIAAGPMFPAG